MKTKNTKKEGEIRQMLGQKAEDKTDSGNEIRRGLGISCREEMRNGETGNKKPELSGHGQWNEFSASTSPLPSPLQPPHLLHPGCLSTCLCPHYHLPPCLSSRFSCVPPPPPRFYEVRKNSAKERREMVTVVLRAASQLLPL